MKAIDVAGTALANTMRSKLRTFLTVVAIVIGAFTLTLTTGLGAGINKYVDNVVEGFGQPGELTVMKQQDMSSVGAVSGSPQEYTEQDAAGGEMFGMPLLTQEDLAAIEDT
ncbi:ABC transporter permease, partial [Xanthomonas citri pv. citri]|nr:ABC transporter permease [Xanthomonas citri pv. citri]